MVSMQVGAQCFLRMAAKIERHYLIQKVCLVKFFRKTRIFTRQSNRKGFRVASYAHVVQFRFFDFGFSDISFATILLYLHHIFIRIRYRCFPSNLEPLP